VGLPNLMHYEIHLINAQDGYAYNKVKVKAFHTRNRVLGLELIPVYRQSARR